MILGRQTCNNDLHDEDDHDHDHDHNVDMM